MFAINEFFNPISQGAVGGTLGFEFPEEKYREVMD